MQIMNNGKKTSRLQKSDLLLSLGLIAFLLMMTAGCAPSGQNECVAFKPIYFAKGDSLTAETFHAIVVHDETGEKLCGWEAAH